MDNPTSPSGHEQNGRLVAAMSGRSSTADGRVRVATPASEGHAVAAANQVEAPAVTPVDHAAMVTERMHEILVTDGTFDAIYRHVLAAPGKRVRARLVLDCHRLLPSAVSASVADAVDLACAMEMLHESSLIHDDICDSSLLRRDSPSVPALFGIRTAARAGFHLAGTALQVLARVLEDNPVVCEHLGEAPGVTYLDSISDLSAGQLVETMAPEVDDAALRRHYEVVAGAKTGTLFRLACSYGGTAGGVDHDRLRALMQYAEQFSLAFQIMDDVRDVEGDPALGKEACGDLDRRVPTWPVIEWLAIRPDAREMWLSADTSSADLQADLVRSGATEAAHDAAIRAAETACEALEVFPSTPARDDLRDLALQVVSR
ncbi:polyprenyl synthetase family protein [Nocardia lijiangensis]|uniref:polyprenyl synthetase family protein n=1 Tax=Nocardia lijiangensis TaxID=299618 RepID=UPI003D75C4FB